MAEVAAAFAGPVISQLAKSTFAQLIASFSKTKVAKTFAQASTDISVIALLASAVAGLIPRKEYEDVLRIDANLYGSFTSVFMANIMGVMVPPAQVSS